MTNLSEKVPGAGNQQERTAEAIRIVENIVSHSNPEEYVSTETRLKVEKIIQSSKGEEALEMLRMIHTTNPVESRKRFNKWIKEYSL